MTISQRAVEAALKASGHSPTEYNRLWMEAAITAALAVDGLCLVPKEATLAMLEAGEETFVSGYSGTPVSTPHCVWVAMVAAASNGEDSPPAGTEG